MGREEHWNKGHLSQLCIHKSGDRKTAATYQSETENAAVVGWPWNFINWGPEC